MKERINSYIKYKISVFIPLYNASQYVDLLIAALEQQTRKDFEVIFCDDGSQDDTRFKIEQYQKTSELHIKYTWQENLGYRPYTAKNNSFHVAEGQIFVFFDQDCIPAPMCLENHLKHLGKRAFVRGRRLYLTPEFSKIINPDIIRNNFEMLRENCEDRTHLGEGRKASMGCNGSVDSKWIESNDGIRIIGVDSGLEDAGLYDDLRYKFGLKCRFLSDVEVFHIYHGEYKAWLNDNISNLRKIIKKGRKKKETDMKLYFSPETQDYGCWIFLTTVCNYFCSYCIADYGALNNKLPNFGLVSGEQWVKRLKQIENKPNMLNFEGGEPTLHPDIVYILKEVMDDFSNIELQTNLGTPIFNDIEKFLSDINAGDNFKINVSFHEEYTDIKTFMQKIDVLKRLNKLGWLFSVVYPPTEQRKKQLRSMFARYRMKPALQPFLGKHNDIFYPDFLKESSSMKQKKTVQCFNRRILIASDGTVYNCHYHLYNRSELNYGNIFQKEEIEFPTDFIECHDYGYCNPCEFFPQKPLKITIKK